MNCQTARETLELARPEGPAAATVAAAREHVTECISCRRAVRQQEEFDARFAAVCSEVPIPSGLRERLLARLEIPATAPSISIGKTRREVSTRRRWLGRASLAVASVVAIGIATWSLWPARPSVDLEEITGLLATAEIDPANLAEFTTFSGGFAPQLPRTMRTGQLESPPRRLGQLEAAIYFFKLGELDGRLAVVPRRFVKGGPLPSATSFSSSSISYGLGFCTTAWFEGDFVFVCCLRGGENENELHRLVRPRPQPA